MAITVRQNRHIGRLEKDVRTDRDRLFGILKRMTDGVAIMGQDYRLRFVNDALKKEFGEPAGMPCYKYFYHGVEPCGERCRIKDVIGGGTSRWEYKLPDGTTYEVMASPYTDVNGEKCQLATYRNITHLKAQKTGVFSVPNSAQK